MAVYEFAVAATLRRAELILVATMDFGITVEGAVFLASSLGVHVHLVDDVALEDLLQFGVGDVYNDGR